MRLSAQPQLQVVFSGSWWISRRGRCAGSACALGLLLLALALLVGHDLVEFGLQRRQVGVDGLFEQALLLGVEGLAPGGELQPLEHGHLVRDLVDRGLLERDLAVPGHDGAHQRADHLAQLRRVELVELRRVDHGA